MLECRTGEGKVEPVYLSFDEPLQMKRVLEDFHRDAELEPQSVDQSA